MSTANKLTYLNTTKSNLKDMINYGLDNSNKIDSNTTFRNYVSSLFTAFIESLNNPETLWNNLPKITSLGTSATLTGTANAPMKIKLNPTQLEQSILPADYQQVEYIESSGTQYIDTGYVYNADDEIEIEFMQLVTPGDLRLFGAYQSGSQICQLGFYNGKLRGNISESNAVTYSTSTKYKCQLKAGKWYYNDSGFGSTYNTTMTRNAYLFCANHGSAFGFTTARVYSLKITRNNQLIKEFVPCYKVSNNTIGMYDLVNEIFYTNAGTGTFIKGDNVLIPSDIHTITGDNEIKICNRNLWDEQWELGRLEVSTSSPNFGQNVNTNDQIRSKNYIKIEPNTYYYGVYGSNTGNIYAVCYDKDYNGITSWTYKDLTNRASLLATPSNAKYMRFYATSEYGTTYNNNIAIIKGSTATTYVEHKEQNYSITLGNIEYCKLSNDYKDRIFKNIPDDVDYDNTRDLGKWYIKKNVGKKIFDGSENEWQFSNQTKLSYKYTNFPNGFPYSQSTVFPIYCNYLRRFDQSGVYNGYRPAIISCLSSPSNILYIYLGDSTIDTVAKLQTWLSTHNLIVYYLLDTPTYTLLGDTLQTELDNIDKLLKSYTNETNITQINDDLPFNMDITAIEDIG